MMFLQKWHGIRVKGVAGVIWILGALVSFSPALFSCSNRSLRGQDQQDVALNSEKGDGAVVLPILDKEARAVKSLPTSTLVYIRKVRPGVKHIYLFDRETQTSKLLSRLDDDGVFGTDVAHIDLSPNRKWIAFSGVFRPSDRELEQGRLAPGIWVVRVDGKRFFRVTKKLPSLPEVPCQPYPEQMSEGSPLCKSSEVSMSLGRPRWSFDGKRIWTNLSYHWEEEGLLQGRSRLAVVSTAGGALAWFSVSSSCQRVAYVATHPHKAKIASIHSACKDGKVHFQTHQRKGRYTETTDVLGLSVGVQMQMESPSWTHDGFGLLFFGHQSHMGIQEQRWSAALLMYERSQRTTRVIVPASLEKQYRGFSMSPDGKHIALCSLQRGAHQPTIEIISTRSGKALQSVRVDGCAPSW